MMDNEKCVHVLFVDDTLLFHTIFKTVVKQQAGGIIVTYCNDGRVALEKLIELTEQGNQPDVIVSDVDMPLMSGIELFETVKSREEFKSVPFMFQTSNSGDEEFEERLSELAKRLGATYELFAKEEYSTILSLIKQYHCS